MSTCRSDDFRCSADTHFDAAIANRDLARYRDKGPGVTTRLLRDLVVDAGEAKGDLLDIGCGVGALTFELLDRGMDQAVGIDASRAHLAAASSEASRRGRAESVRLVESDFVDMADTLPAVSVVALDRVVCCYPSFAPLLDASARHATRCLAISYPRTSGTCVVRLGSTTGCGASVESRFAPSYTPRTRCWPSSSGTASPSPAVAERVCGRPTSSCAEVGRLRGCRRDVCPAGNFQCDAGH